MKKYRVSVPTTIQCHKIYEVEAETEGNAKFKILTEQIGSVGDDTERNNGITSSPLISCDFSEYYILETTDLEEGT